MFPQVTVRIIDFGLSVYVEGEFVQSDSIVGTLGFHAPEMFFDDILDFRSDIFSLGLTFCVTVCRI